MYSQTRIGTSTILPVTSFFIPNSTFSFSHFFCTHPLTPRYAVLIEKVVHFSQKVGHFRKKPTIFWVGQVLVALKSQAFSALST
jgi:hypothetical protein